MRLSVCLVLFCLGLMSGPALAEEVAPDVRQQIEMLASKAMSEAVRVVQESGAIYPFAMLMDKEQTVRLVGYSGKEDVKPPATEYVGALVKELQETTSVMLSVQAGAVLKMHVVTDDKGEQIPGIWMLVDHRLGSPLIIFQPLIPGEKPNHFSLGPQLFEASSLSLFER